MRLNFYAVSVGLQLLLWLSCIPVISAQDDDDYDDYGYDDDDFKCKNGGTYDPITDSCKCILNMHYGRFCEKSMFGGTERLLTPWKCSDHGTPIGSRRCSCDDGWSGDKCRNIVCEHGSPNRGSTCECYDGWTGIHCDQKKVDDGWTREIIKEPAGPEPKVNLKQTHSKSWTDGPGLIIVSTFAVIAAVLAIGIVVICVLRRRKRHQHPPPMVQFQQPAVQTFTQPAPMVAQPSAPVLHQANASGGAHKYTPMVPSPCGPAPLAQQPMAPTLESTEPPADDVLPTYEDVIKEEKAYPYPIF